jgi:hypothetical protein
MHYVHTHAKAQTSILLSYWLLISCVTYLQCDLSKRYIRGKNRVVNFLSKQHTPTWSHLLLILMCVCVCVVALSDVAAASFLEHRWYEWQPLSPHTNPCLIDRACKQQCQWNA